MHGVGEGYMQSEPAKALRAQLAALDHTQARRRSFLRWWSVAAPLAAAAAWLVLFRTPATFDVTAKGSGTVALLVGHGGQVGPWTGGPLSPGDQLQLSWTSAASAYVAVIGREDGGATAVWFPENTPRSERLEAGARAFGSSLRFEPPFRGTVYAFLADQPFSAEPLESAIREGREPTFSGKTITLHVPRTP